MMRYSCLIPKFLLTDKSCCKVLPNDRLIHLDSEKRKKNFFNVNEGLGGKTETKHFTKAHNFAVMIRLYFYS